MADILCNWLNHEVKLSRQIDPNTVAREFSSGYLMGELLRKYELQEDFGQFSNNSSTNAKLSNFTRLEPTLRLLEIPFDTVRAKEIMTEKQGVAIKILYELFVALENKRKSQLTGTAMETMRPKAPKVKEEMNREYYQNRLKQINPRQSEMQLEQLIGKWKEHKERLLENDLRSRYEEDERLRQEQQRKRHEAHQRSKKRQQELNDQVARILAAKVHIPKPPADKTLAGIRARQQRVRNQETQNTQKSLVEFEARLKAMQPVTSEGEDKKIDDELLAYIKEEALNPNRPRPTEDPEYIKPRSNAKYIRKIQQRTREDEEAKVEREKRRRKVLVDQLKAHEAQEDARREEEIVNRLMRQSQVERRIVVQLLQTRHEKAVILENRKFREEQYQERRRKEFEDALNVEAEMAKLAKERYKSELAAAKREHNRIMEERRKQKYEKHYKVCHKITLDIVDYACKFGEYRELTGGLVPHKLFREWTAMFLSEVAIYPDIEGKDKEETVEDWLEKEREQLLNEADFTEYKLMYGEWAIPDQTSLSKPRDNKVLGYIVHRLFELVYPPPLPPSAPIFQEFPIKIAIVGKAFSGKSTIIQSMCDRYGFAHILVSRLITEAVEAYKLGEVETLPTPPPTVEQLRGLLETEETERANKKDPLLDQPVGPSGDDPQQGSQEIPQLPQEAAGTNLTVQVGAGGDGTSTLISWEARKPHLSRRAQCGKRIFDELCKGRNVPDEVIAELVVDAVRQIPEGQGWVLDDFPLNLEQAQQFEKFLTGYDEKAAALQEEMEKASKKPRRPELVNNPNPAPEAAAPESGIDLLLLLDITDEEALKRSEGRTVAPVKAVEYHQEYKPPPEGAATGLSGQEKVEQIQDPNYDKEQIQKRLVGFEDSWTAIESWYHKFNVVYSVDGNKEREEVFYDVDRLVQEIFRKIDLKKHPPPPTPPLQAGGVEGELGAGGASATEGTGGLDGDGQPEDGGTGTVVVDTVAPEPTEQQPSTPHGSDKEGTGDEGGKKSSRGGKGKKSPRGSASPKGGRGASQKAKKGDREGSVGSDGGKRSRSGSPKSKRGSSDSKRSASGKGGKGKGTKRSPSPAEVPAQPALGADGAAEGAPEPPPPAQPGDDDWECVKEPVDLEVAEILAPQWEFIEDTYVKGLQVTFKNIRDSRELSILYLHQVREDFKTYLMRPDEKQAHVSQYQDDFNSVSDDVRNDEETKSEWHEKVFTLQELLWDISDKRKQSAEAERKNIMSDGWLPDRLGVLTNDYITLMQIELDKFYDTLKVLKDYYKSMDGSKSTYETEEGSSNARLPLLEILPQDGNQASNMSRSPSKAASTSASKKSQGSERGKSANKPEENPDDAEKPKIPLVPRRPVSADFAPQGITQPKKEQKKAGGADPAKKKGGAAGGNDMHAETPVPPSDDDEKILFDAANYVFQHLQALMAAEQAAKEAEEEAERLAMLEREKEKEKQAKAKDKAPGSKKGPKGSAGKKGGAPNVGTAAGGGGKDSAMPSGEFGGDQGEKSEEELMAEEAAKKAVKDKIRQEYIGALTLEEQALRVRVELIKFKAIQVIQDVKIKAEDAYGSMNDWLGARFRHEMAAIDRVCESLEQAVEMGEKVQEELILDQDEFQFHEDRIAFRDDSPPPRPEPEEVGDAVHFTVAQLVSLLAQFHLSAPSGQISAKGFIDIMSDLDALTQGQETLPDVWVSLNHDKLTEIATNVTPNTEYVDWRKFLLALSKPWPHPTQTQLLELLTAYKNEDEGATGFIDKGIFDKVMMWFKDDSRANTPDDPNEPFPFARYAALKDFFFMLFSEPSPSDLPITQGTADENQEREESALLDYIKMLLYFSGDMEPVEGFLRALSVSAQTHIPRLIDPVDTTKTPKTANINTQRSEITIASEAPVNDAGMMESGLSIAQSGTGPSETGQAEQTGVVPAPNETVPPIDIPESAIEAEVSLDSFLLVLQHGQTTQGDSNRFAAGADMEGENMTSLKRLQEIWNELGNGQSGPVKFTALSQHPHIQDIIAACYTYKFPDLSVATAGDE